MFFELGFFFQVQPAAAVVAETLAATSSQGHQVKQEEDEDVIVEDDVDDDEPIGVFEAVETFDSCGGAGDKMDLTIGDVVRVYKIESSWAMAMKVN